MSDLININHFNFDNNNLFTNFVSDASFYLPAFEDDSLYGDSTFNDLQKTYIYNIKDTLNNTFNGDNILNIKYSDFKTPLFNDTTVWTYFQFINIDNKLFDKNISYWNHQNDPIIGQAYNNLKEDSPLKPKL